MLGTLLLLSLVLVTASFRSRSIGGPQSAGATVLRPFQVGAERVAQPFRDAYGWVSGAIHAKREVTRLKAQLRDARQEATQYREAFELNKQLVAIAGYRAPPSFPAGFQPVSAAVIGYPGPFDRDLAISAGTADGVRLDAAVVTPDGLVGRISAVTSHTSRVTLLIDGSSSVGAMDVRTRARGIIRGRPGSGDLTFEFVRKKMKVEEGDTVVTAGAEPGGRLPSLYPRGIGIGRVTYASQTDTEPYKRIQVQPYVDFDRLESVIVLVQRPEAR